MQNRWKSPVLWMAVISQIMGIIILANLLPIELADHYKAILFAILELLTTIGVLNNPKDSVDW